MDHFCRTSFLSILQNAPRSPLTWFSTVRQPLPSFLLADRLYHPDIVVPLRSVSDYLSLIIHFHSGLWLSPINNNNNNNNKLTRVLYSTYFCQFVCLFVISPSFNKFVVLPSVHYFTKSAFRSITEFLECNSMTFVSAVCTLATYWPQSLYCKFLSA